MRILYSCLITLFTAFNALAVTVQNTAGNLASLITDKSITELEVSGTINSVDFKFIADSLNLASLNLNEATIESCTTNIPLFTSANTYEGNTLPSGCFANSKMKTIVLPNSLTAIGEGAFLCCDSLTTIVLPQQLVTIADYAFSACNSLEGITIPASVTNIGKGAFSHCPALKSVTVEDAEAASNLIINDNVFVGCESLTAVNLGNRTSAIGKYAFSNCSAAEFAITLGTDSKLAEIGEGAFLESGLSQFDFTLCPLVKIIPMYAFASSKLSKIEIPSSVQFIGEGAFFYNTQVTSISLDKNQESISKLQFAGCNTSETTGLTDATQEIGEYAYYGWDNTEKLFIPANVSFINDQAFANMNKLARIASANTTAPQLGNNVFEGIMPNNVFLATKIESQGYDTDEQWKEFHHLLNGDADNNKRININDITSIISNNKGKQPKSFIFEAADANIDNNVDEKDVNDIINAILQQ